MPTLAFQPESNRCPNCAETIEADAILCRFCQRGISPLYFRACPGCAEMVRKDATRCRYCQSELPEETSRIAESNFPKPRVLRQTEPVPKFSVNTELINERVKALVAKIRQSGQLNLDEFETRQFIREIVNNDDSVLTMMERGLLLQKIFDEIFGFGPLGPLLRDPSVKDIYVYGPQQVHVFRSRTGFESVDVSFESEQHLQEIVEQIFSKGGFSYSPENRVNTAVLSKYAEVIVIAPSNESASSCTTLILKSIS